jgi:hypothetical protein
MASNKPDPNDRAENNRLNAARKARQAQQFKQYAENPRAFWEKESKRKASYLKRAQSVERRARLAKEPTVNTLPPPRKNAVPRNVINTLPPPRPSLGGKKSWDLPRVGQYKIPDIPHGIYPRKPLPDPKLSDKPKSGRYVPPPPGGGSPGRSQYGQGGLGRGGWRSRNM